MIGRKHLNKTVLIFIAAVLTVVVLVVLLLMFVNPVGILAAASASERKTEISFPENLAYTFDELKTENYELYDEFYVTGRDEKGKKCDFLRSYYLNSYTGEEIISSHRVDNGQFEKGYYVGDYCRCTYFRNGEMKLTGKKIGKVYTFLKGKLKNVSELSSYDGIFGNVYVITYYNSDGKRLAVKTFPSSASGNKTLKKTLYEKYYNSLMFPISEKRFNKLTL